MNNEWLLQGFPDGNDGIGLGRGIEIQEDFDNFVDNPYAERVDLRILGLEPMQEIPTIFSEEDSNSSNLSISGSLSLLSSTDSNSTHHSSNLSSSLISWHNGSSGSAWSIPSNVSDPSPSLQDILRGDSNDIESPQFSPMSNSDDMASLFSADSFDSDASTVHNSLPTSEVEDDGSSSEDELPPNIDRPIPAPDDVETAVVENDPAPEDYNVIIIESSRSQDVAELAVDEDKPSVSGTQPQYKAPNTSQKRPAEADLADNDDDDGQTCTICLEPWSNSGDHRLSSLKCGHLYGHKCIIHWLGVAKNRGVKRCPQCNKSAKLSDVRILYAKKLITMDTVDHDAIKLKLEAAEREKNKLEVELKKAELKTQLQEKQLAELRVKLSKSSQVIDKGSKATTIASQGKGPGNGEVKLIHQFASEISKDGGCRILAYKESLNMLVISQSTNSLFSGFGISKMNTLNFRTTHFVFLHTKAIRDLAFHTTDNDLLLSVSLDRTAKLLDVSSNNIVQTFVTENPLWSCCWDVDNTNIFFVGSQNGNILQYDMRQTSGPISRMMDNNRAVLSLASVPSTPGGALPRGGFISCHLDSCWAYERVNAEYAGKQLPVDGPFVAMRYDRLSDHLLLSSRPSARSLRSRHIVCELDRSPSTNTLTCNEIQTFMGGVTQNLLSRPCQMKIAGYGSVVVAHNESSNTLAVYNMANGSRVCNQPSKEPVLDICPISVNNNQYLVTISEKTLRVYNVFP